MENSRRGSRPVREFIAIMRDRSEADIRCVYEELASREATPVPGVHSLTLQALTACTRDLGHPPSRRQYDAWRSRTGNPREWMPSSSIRRAYRTWPEALDKAGLEPSPDVRSRRLLARGPDYTEAEMLAALARCSRDLGSKFLSRRVYREWAVKQALDQRVPRSAETFERHFGGWEAALTVADLRSGATAPRPTPRHAMTEEEVVTGLAAAIDDVGFLELTTRTYSIWRGERLNDPAWAERPLPSISTIRNKLGGWGMGRAIAYTYSRRWEERRRSA